MHCLRFTGVDPAYARDTRRYFSYPIMELEYRERYAVPLFDFNTVRANHPVT